MAKRFTDTDLFKKKFIRGLEAPYKLLWMYIIHDCNHAGIWEMDLEVAAIRLGVNLDIETSRKVFGDKIIEVDNGEKWFIPSFIEFQYGELNSENRVHNSIIKILKKEGVFKPLTNPLQGVKDKDMDKVLVQEKDGKGGVGEKPLRPTKHLFSDFWDTYDKKRSIHKAEKAWEKLNEQDRADAMAGLPEYKLSTPDKKYRKDPATWLNNRGWEDEIIIKQNGQSTDRAAGAKAIIAEDYK